MQQALKEKLETVIELVDNAMVDPDIDIEYCIPEVATTTDSCDVSGDPYILVKYSEDNTVERKVPLRAQYLEKEADDIANLVTFSIEQFKEEVDSLKHGAQ
jgi:hypothetical protein